MKSGTVALVGVLLGVGIATAGVVMGGPKPGVSISGNYTPAGDSVNIRVTVSSKDAQGQAVSQFTINWVSGGTTVATATVPGALSVTVVRTFKAPLAGDTTIYTGCATATDRRGQTSNACSAPLRVLGPPWTPPTPPVIQIDTIAYNPSVNDTITFYVNPPTWGGPATVGRLSMAPGDTVTLCGLRWKDGYAVKGAPITWATSQPGAMTFSPVSPDCALIHAIMETSLNVQGLPQSWLGRP